MTPRSKANQNRICFGQMYLPEKSNFYEQFKAAWSACVPTSPVSVETARKAPCKNAGEIFSQEDHPAWKSTMLTQS